MSIELKKEYLKEIRLRYKNATKKQKTLILDEFCSVCSFSRKHGIRLLSKSYKDSERRPGPIPKYDEQVKFHLIKLWKLMRCMCSKRMKEALPVWLEYYEHEGLQDRTKELLREVSPATIDRILKPMRDSWKKGKSTTKPGSYIKSKIPIELPDSHVKTPGFVEADTVAHCGTSLEGHFANTLTVTDLFSGWTESRATWGKSGKAILGELIDIRSKLPFPMLGFACDNGSEFINYDLQLYERNLP